MFLEWEKRSGLDSLVENDIPVWIFFRAWFFKSIVLEDSSYSNIETELDSSKNRLNKIHMYFYFLLNSFVGVIKVFKHRKRPTVVVSHAVDVIKEEDANFNPFFDPLVKNLNNVVTLEYPDFNTHRLHHGHRKLNQHIIYADILYLLEFFSVSKPYQNIVELLCTKCSEIYSTLTDKPLDEQSFKVFSHRILKRNLKRVWIYRFLFKLMKPKHVILKSAYDPSASQIISAANESHVIEIQHSHIYSHHMGYNMPINETSPLYKLLPNSICVESDYYKELLIENRWKPSSIIPIGALSNFRGQTDTGRTSSSELKELSSLKQNYTKVITIFNQFTITKHIFAFLINAETFSSTLFLVKLHPKKIQEQERDIFEWRLPKNVRLVYTGSIQDVLDISDCSAGVYSTAIIDSLRAQKPTSILKILGSELMEDLINKKKCYPANSLEELIDFANGNYSIETFELNSFSTKELETHLN